MKSIFLSLGLMITVSLALQAQTEVALQWQRAYGGSSWDIARSVKKTNDGGFIIAGYTDSNDGNVNGNHGSVDYWVVKTDQLGMIQWQKCYGGEAIDEAYDIIQTTDGGYIIAGTTESYYGQVTGCHGQQDIWIVKIDPSGNLQWQKCYGGSNYDYVSEIQQTTDGGYIFAGESASHDGDVTGCHGSYDYWVVKIDQAGAIQWAKCYGGSDDEAAFGIQQTSDGGFIVDGASMSNNGDVTYNHGKADYWVVKIDQSGAIQWQKSYGGSDDDIAWGRCQQTTDGGYVISGSTKSSDGDITFNHGETDYWIIKTDSSGVIQWQKTYGGSGEDIAYNIQQSSDGGYILCGSSTSNDGDVTGNHGYMDYWVVKTDQSGTIQWQRSCGGSADDVAYDIQQTTLSSYIVVGYTMSNDGDVTNSKGYDFWVVMLCNNDPLDISISDTAYCYNSTLTATAGFGSYLWSTGETTRSIIVDTGGIYKVTAINASGCPSEKTINVNDPIQPYNEEQICMVTLDSVSGKNVIVVEKTLNVGIDSIHLYRMDNQSSLYKVIGTLGINELSIFTDNEAIPAQQSYQYKISIKDTCGKESSLSAMHKTILLQANSGINHEINLFWNAYEGFEYSNFEIYRKNTAKDGFILIANVPNTIYAYTDLTPPSGTNLYQVRVSKDSSCVPTKSSYSHVSSNVITSGNNGIGENQELSITVSPNPATEKIVVGTSKSIEGGKLVLLNISGQQLITRQITSPKTQIDISSLPSGVYVVRLTNDRTVQVGKFIKE